MKRMCTLILALVCARSMALAWEVSFEKTVVDRTFRSEGVAVADVNRDGKKDVIAGDVWYEAPDWQIHEVRPAQTYDGSKGYSRCFINFAQDVNGDGWVDSIVVGMPGESCVWYENPKEGWGHWKERIVWTSACNETPVFEDLRGNGKPVLLFGVKERQRLAWFSIPEKLDDKWDIHYVSGPESPAAERYSHGLGVGDVNGDGRNDVIIIQGWYEAPEDPTKPEWKFHKVHLGPECANMYAYDVDGDGDNDVIGSSAHAYGIWWFEQRKTDKGLEFKEHMVFNKFSQAHALNLIDMNGDGLKDIVTGKRYYAHQGNDPGGHDPAVLYWFELRRTGEGKVEFVPHLVDDDSGVGTQFVTEDMNGDGRPDIVTSNKKGVRVFTQR